jgi:hypothetical protein
MTAPATIMLSVPLHRSSPDPSDRVLGEAEGLIAQRPAEIRLTRKGLYLSVLLADGQSRRFGVNVNELAKIAADRIEEVMIAEDAAR